MSWKTDRTGTKISGINLHSLLSALGTKRTGKELAVAY